MDLVNFPFPLLLRPVLNLPIKWNIVQQNRKEIFSVLSTDGTSWSDLPPWQCDLRDSIFGNHVSKYIQVIFSGKIRLTIKNLVSSAINYGPRDLSRLSHRYRTQLNFISKFNFLLTADTRLQRSPSSSQEENHLFTARKKFILIVIANSQVSFLLTFFRRVILSKHYQWCLNSISQIKMYIYNWTKDKIEALTILTTNFSEWLQARSCLLISIVEQKMGLFFNLPIHRSDDSKKVSRL